MCCGCWNDAGRPVSRSWRTRHLAALIERFYENHPTGGPLHVLTDDWNTETRIVLFGLRHAVGIGDRWVDGTGELGAVYGPRGHGRWRLGLDLRDVSWRGVRLCLWFFSMRERTRIAVLAHWNRCAPDTPRRLWRRVGTS